MGTLVLNLLIMIVAAAVGGAVSWYVRRPKVALPPAPAGSASNPAPQAENTVEHFTTMIARLHQLTVSVAADVGEHNCKVQAINDDLSKGGDVVSVVERLIRANHEMQSQLQVAETRMQQQSREIEAHCKEARTDVLTKLANRRAFDDEIGECIEAITATRQPSCMMMLDVDYFKKVNDVYGHLAGDEVLRNVARVLRREASGDAIVCRYGGEEFALIYRGMDTKAALPLAERARAVIGEEIVEFQGLDLRVTVSGGFAELKPHESADEFVRRADLALYDCKNIGRNCGCWHDGTASRPIKAYLSAAGISLQPKRPASETTEPVAKKNPGSANSTNEGSHRTDEHVFKLLEAPAAAKLQRRDRIVGLSDYETICRDIDRRLAEFQREGGSASLLLVTLDDRLQLTETHGAKAIDLANCTLIQYIKAEKREMDHAAHLNDDVFALLLPGAGVAEAKAMGERIRRGIETRPLSVDGEQLPFTVSVGVTEFRPRDEREQLLKRAEEALDTACSAGGNRMVAAASLASTAPASRVAR